MAQRSFALVALLSCIACHHATSTHVTPDVSTKNGSDGNTVVDEDLALPRIGSSSCVVKPDRTAWCWQLGDANSSWVQVPASRGWLRFDNGIGIQEDGSLWQQDGNALVAVLPDKTWREASQGDEGIYAIDSNGVLWSQTETGFAQVGNDTQWVQISQWAGGMSDDQNYEVVPGAVALDTSGQLFWLGFYDPSGGFPGTYIPDPLPVDPLPNQAYWMSFSQGCGIAHDGDFNHVRCMDGEGFSAPVSDTTSWTAVSGMRGRGCAIAQDGSLWCWGDNAFGEAGTGQASGLRPAVSGAARRVGDGNQWLAVGVSLATTCGYQLQNGQAQLFCWGSNYAGQVAGGARPYVDPNQFTGSIQHAASSWRTVSSGSGSTCAVGDDTSLWCWGLFNPACAVNGSCNPNPRLDFPLLLTPTAVGSLGWVDVRTSVARYPDLDSHACGLRQNAAGNGNDLWCWGQGLNAAPEPMAQVAAGQNWGFFGKASAGLSVISADGNNLTVVNFDMDPNDSRHVWRMPNPTAQGRWVDASVGVAEITGIWRDATVQPATQNVYKKDRLFADAMTLKYTGDWAAIGTLSDDGISQSCGIKVNGTLWCGTGQTPTLSQIQTASAAPWTSYIETYAGGVGVQDGRLWLVASANAVPQPLASGLTTLVSVEGRGYWESMEALSYCGIFLGAQQARKLTCWGWGVYGELGINDGVQGPALYYPTPQPVSF